MNILSQKYIINADYIKCEHDKITHAVFEDSYSNIDGSIVSQLGLYALLPSLDMAKDYENRLNGSARRSYIEYSNEMTLYESGTDSITPSWCLDLRASKTFRASEVAINALYIYQDRSGHLSSKVELQDLGNSEVFPPRRIALKSFPKIIDLSYFDHNGHSE